MYYQQRDEALDFDTCAALDFPFREIYVEMLESGFTDSVGVAAD
jgi:hypothetical protein